MKTLRQLEKEGQERRSQEVFLGGWRLLLVAFLAVFAICGYLYFFTDLIRSHGEPHKEVKQSVRKALPRKGLPSVRASSAVKAAGAAAPPTSSGEKPADKITTPHTPLPTAVQQRSVPPAPVVVAPKASYPEPLRQSAATLHPAAVPPVVPVPATIIPVKSAPKGVLPPEKSQLHASPAPPVSPPKPAATSTPAAVTGKERYLLRCGPFTTERELVPARALLKKLGLVPVVSSGPKRSTHMYRLHVAEYNDAATAAAEKKKLLEAAPDAFVLPHGGVYELIAGSYHEEGGGKMEQERLSTWGVTVQLIQVLTPVATRQLSAGVFSTSEAAAALAAKLKGNGISCTVIGRPSH